MACCIHYGIKLGGWHRSDYWRFGLAGFAPHGGATLDVGIDDDDTLRGVVNAKIMSKPANDVLAKAHRAVRHTAKKIAMFRDLIAWFFTFGLVGLGMQITMASIRQADAITEAPVPIAS